MSELLILLGLFIGWTIATSWGWNSGLNGVKADALANIVGATIVGREKELEENEYLEDDDVAQPAAVEPSGGELCGTCGVGYVTANSTCGRCGGA